MSHELLYNTYKYDSTNMVYQTARCVGLSKSLCLRAVGAT